MIIVVKHSIHWIKSWHIYYEGKFFLVYQRKKYKFYFRQRRTSGSYGGAYESEDELAGLTRVTSINTEYEPLENSRDNFSSGEPLDNSMGEPEEEKMKRKLKFFFMNPVDKYRAT